MTKLTKKSASTEVTVDQDALSEIQGDSEKYRENLDRSDMSVPFLNILQGQSPQCNKRHDRYIEGAEASDIFDTVNQKVWKTRDADDNSIFTLKVLPVFYKRSYVEWIPRNDGGGFVTEWSVADANRAITQRNSDGLEIVQQNSPVGTPGNQLTNTHSHFVYVVDGDEYWPAIITMQSTQIKPSQNWNSLISKQRLPSGELAPRFFTFWSATTDIASNDQGSWFKWRFEKAGDVLTDDRMDLYREAKAFADSIIANEVVVDHTKNESVNTQTTETDAVSGDTDGDEVPF